MSVGAEAPVDVDVLRHEIEKTYTAASTEPDKEFIFPTGRGWLRSSAIPSPSSTACRRRAPRALPASRTTGSTAAFSQVRSCSISAAAQAPTCSSQRR